MNRTATDGATPESATEELHVTDVRSLSSDNPERADLLEREPRHQGGTLALAIDARRSDVQPHFCSSTNPVVLFSPAHPTEHRR